MGFDLHTHSIYSDGLVTPGRIIECAAGMGLEGAALTDHDSFLGLPEFLEAGTQRGIIAVPGVELTAHYHGNEMHLLGYGIDHRSPSALEVIRRIKKARYERAGEILHRLARAGYELDLDEVAESAGFGFIGRAHIYRTLKERGLVGPDPGKDWYNEYLGNDGIAYVPTREIDARDCIGHIHQAGGVAVLAHPGRYGFGGGVVKVLAGFGLDGIEIEYPIHSPTQRAYYRHLAQKYGLKASGGSDYHGAPGETRLGQATAGRKDVEELLAGTPSKLS